MDNAFDQIRKKEEEQVYTHRIVFNTKEGEIYDSPPQKKLYESVFVEVDKTIFNKIINIIIGEIYNHPILKIEMFQF